MIQKQVSLIGNKTGTSKVGAISKAQKARNIFKKNLKFLNFFRIVSKNVKGESHYCRIVSKNVKGETLWAFLTYIQLQNIKKLEKGTLLRH